MSKLIESSQLDTAAKLLTQGHLVAIPTETVYGLAASIRQPAALRRIFEEKERPFFDPLIVHVSSIDQVLDVANDFPGPAQVLAKKFWPGPLTLVLPKRDDLNPLISSGLETVGIRIPNHPMALELIQKAGPLAAPSANKFGKTSPTQAAHVMAEFPDANIWVLDGGSCQVGVESTVVTVGASELVLHRPGAVTLQDLSAALSKEYPEIIFRKASSAASPGQVQHHYMPSVPLTLIRLGQDLSLVEQKLSKRFHRPMILDLGHEPAIAARILYDQMRVKVAAGADLLVVEWSETWTGGFWDAIEDRLVRAATLDLRK